MSNPGRLTISRQSGEKFYIGDDIEVMVRIDPDRDRTIRVTIVAPRDVRITRAELMPQKLID